MNGQNKGRKKKEIGFVSPFATRLRELLAATSSTQSMLAAAIGVSRQAVGEWEKGNTVPDILDFQKIADYFGVSLEYLAGRSKNRSTDKVDISVCEDEQAVNQMKDRSRLTIKTTILDGYTLKCMCTFGRDMLADDELGCGEYCNECGRDCKKCGIQEAFDRLAEYENTGLSPDEIKRILYTVKLLNQYASLNTFTNSSTEDNFKRLLFEKDMNISALSRATHISRTTLTDVLKGRNNNITLSKAKAICNYLGCSLDELFTTQNKISLSGKED